MIVFRRILPTLRTGNNTISDNTIAHYGITYPSAVGVLVMHSDCNTIAHNLIHHGDYTGISVGWSWGYRRSAARGNRVEYNHIHHIGYNNLLSDMGSPVSVPAVGCAIHTDRLKAVLA